MPFKKGVPKEKTGGRVKGTPNKVPTNVKDFLAEKISSYIMTTEGKRNFMADIALCTPAKRLEIMERYLKYFQAPVSTVKIEGGGEGSAPVEIVVRYEQKALAPDDDDADEQDYSIPV